MIKKFLLIFILILPFVCGLEREVVLSDSLNYSISPINCKYCNNSVEVNKTVSEYMSDNKTYFVVNFILKNKLNEKINVDLQEGFAIPEDFYFTLNPDKVYNNSIIWSFAFDGYETKSFSFSYSGEYLEKEEEILVYSLNETSSNKNTRFSILKVSILFFGLLSAFLFVGIIILLWIAILKYRRTEQV